MFFLTVTKKFGIKNNFQFEMSQIVYSKNIVDICIMHTNFHGNH